jgi:formiminotetrahydrofolate cyclodeaminase
VTEFADQRVRTALAAIAARGEPPAAGVASALACAAAAALVELSAALAADRIAAEPGAGNQAEARMRGHAERARELRELLIAVADDDLDAYGAVIAAPTAADRARALALASDPPLAIAEAAAEIAEAAAEIAAAGDWPFSADAIVAARLAAAAAAAGEAIIVANLGGRPDDPRTARARGAVERAGRAAEAGA